MALANKHPFKVPAHALRGIGSIRRMPDPQRLIVLENNTQKIVDNLVATHPDKEVLAETRRRYPYLIGNQKLYTKAKEDLYVLLAQYAGEFSPGSKSNAYNAAVSLLLDSSRLGKRLGIL